MADSKEVIEENPDRKGEAAHNRQMDRLHNRNVKAGTERSDRRSATGHSGAVKKSGHGGKFTWDGPTTEEDYAEPPPVALDSNDPNYVDPEEEEEDKRAAIGEVEVAKVANDAAA
jgi:hypothetical protein